MEPIAVESLKELQVIFEWVRGREEELTDSKIVLVGGWAVYAYNQYWGSLDIDLITNNTTRRSLRKHLLDNHNFHPDSESISVYKDTAAGKVIIDFANRGNDPFEGNHGSLNLGIVDGNIEIRSIDTQELPVPSRSVLLMMKIKAAWDRAWRYELGKSDAPDWELSKIIKDYSDILALIDPEKGGDGLDVEQMGEFFSEHEFIKPVLDKISESRDAAEKYGITLDQAKEIVDRLKSVVF